MNKEYRTMNNKKAKMQNYNPKFPAQGGSARLARRESERLSGGKNRQAAENTSKIKSAEEAQNEAFRNMSAEKKIELTSKISAFCLELNKLREHGN